MSLLLRFSPDIPILVTDDLNFWSDGSVKFIGDIQLTITAQDLNFWADAYSQTVDVVSTGDIPLTFAENLAQPWTDSLLIGYGNLVDDTLIFSDDTGIGYGLLTTDDLAAWDDNTFVVLGYEEPFADNLSQPWTDNTVIVFGYEEPFTDDANNLADSVVVVYGYEEPFSDSSTLTDDLAIGYGLVIDEDAFNLADAYAQFMAGAIELTFADDIAAWAEAVTLILSYEESLSDDSFNLIDDAVLVLSYEKIFAEDAFNLADTTELVLGFEKAFAEDTNNLADAYAQIMAGAIELAFSDDAFNLLDAFVVVMDYQEPFEEDINSWSDDLLIGYGLVISEDTNFWADFAVAANDIQLVFTENAANWLDAATFILSYEWDVQEALIFTDELGIGHGMLMSDDANQYVDTFEFTYDYLIAVSDNASNWLDAITLEYGYALTLADTFGFSDQLDLLLGYLLDIADDNSGNWADLEQNLVGYLMGLTDDANSWADALAAEVGIAIILSDAGGLNWLDDIAAELLTQLNYAVVLVDSLGAEWADSIALQTPGGIGPVSIDIVRALAAITIATVVVKSQITIESMTFKPRVAIDTVEVH